MKLRLAFNRPATIPIFRDETPPESYLHDAVSMDDRVDWFTPDLTAAEQVLVLKLVHFEKLDGDLVWLVYEVTSR